MYLYNSNLSFSVLLFACLLLFSEGISNQSSYQALVFGVCSVLPGRLWLLQSFLIWKVLLLLVGVILFDIFLPISVAFFGAGIMFIIFNGFGFLLFQQLLSLLILGNANDLGVHEALAEIELLMACPAEVLGTDVAIVRLRALSIHCVSGVALRTTHALTKSQC